MVKNTYETPQFTANDLYMFDGIAETCWGYGHVNIRVYGDVNKNNKYDEGIDEQYFVHNYYVADSGHCNDVAKQVQQDLVNVKEEYKKYLSSVSSGTNSKSLNDSPNQDFHS